MGKQIYFLNTFASFTWIGKKGILIHTPHFQVQANMISLYIRLVLPFSKFTDFKNLTKVNDIVVDFDQSINKKIFARCSVP